MRTPFLCGLLMLVIPSCEKIHAEQITGLQFQSLQKTCIPEADRVLVAALVRTESDYNPNALSLNYPGALARKLGFPPGRVYLKRQPGSPTEARRWAKELLEKRITLSVGLMQVNLESDYSLEELIDPCSNLRIGWKLFTQKYDRAATRVGGGQAALRMAISSYNSGSFVLGFENGYVRSVLGNAAPAH